MNIQWYPGHMVKTKRQIEESLKIIDVVIELLDARIPVSSKNPDIDELIKNKPKVVLLNKCTLADEKITREWIKYFKDKGIYALDIDSVSGKNISKVYPVLKEAVKDKFERKAAKGIVGRPIRALVVGIPNVGKSSFINKISNKSSAKTGDLPGVTRSKQWIKVNKEFELLDTPGILWPKFEDEKVALHLAYTKSIKEEIIDIEELSLKFIDEMKDKFPKCIQERYKVEMDKTAIEILKEIGKKRGCIVSGGEIDTLRAANILFEDYRSGKLGKITLESPKYEEEVQNED